MYGGPESSTYCNLRKHMQLDKNTTKLRKHFHQFDNTFVAFSKRNADTQTALQNRNAAKQKRCKTEMLQFTKKLKWTLKSDEHSWI